MTGDSDNEADEKMPESGKVAKISRAALQVASGAIPFAGGALSAIAGAWSEAEQERVNRFFEAWIRMLQDEFKEKAQTILDIMARLNLQDEAIAARVESKEFQSLLNKAFREWAGVESEQKRSVECRCLDANRRRRGSDVHRLDQPVLGDALSGDRCDLQ
jgi:hypothetical protein